MNRSAARRLSFISLYLLPLVLYSAGNPQTPKDPQRLGKTTANDHYAVFLINNLFNYYGNNGNGSYNPFAHNSALEFPKGSETYVNYEDGFVWGGYQRLSSVISVVAEKLGGSHYRSSLQAGRIFDSGKSWVSLTAESPNLAKNRLFQLQWLQPQ